MKIHLQTPEEIRLQIWKELGRASLDRHHEWRTPVLATAESIAPSVHPVSPTVRAAALLHDVGKIGVPDQILNKPGKLTHEEYAIFQKHPVYGRDILEPISFLVKQEVVEVLLRLATIIIRFGGSDSIL